MQREDKDDNKKMDGFIQKRMKAEGLEHPSLNFTNAIISKIEAEKGPRQVLAYKPLIAKKVWYGLGALLIGIFGFLFYGNTVTQFNWWSEKTLLEFGKLDLLEKMPKFSVSDIYIYAFVGMAFFVGLQIVLLKNHFNKRYYLD